MTRTVGVRTPTASYDVHVGRGILDELGLLTRDACGGDLAFLVSDDNVWPLYGRRAQEALEGAGYACASFVFPAGEGSKNLATYGRCLEAMAEARCTRDTVVVALGGGVTGDLAGFAAATYMRGTRVVQVPTSLLAMVDSSVGGKTAVDLPEGKNLVGAFFHPSVVVADVECLATVPADLLRDSMGELIKHGVLASPELFEELRRAPLTQRPLDLDRIAEVVAENVSIKRDVVNADERERGLRQTLNLGHTLGHAIEAAGDYRLGHGSSVAAGLCVVARGCAAAGITPAAVADAIEECVASYGLPVTSGEDAGRLLALAAADKKRHGGTVNLVVPLAIGRVEVRATPWEEFARIVELGLAGR